MFSNRAEAGALLADALQDVAARQPIVLALPRGGVPVAFEIAERLHAPLDVVLVRKIGAPYQQELGIGAIVDGARPVVVLNEELARETGATREYIERQRAENLREIERRGALYRKGRKGYDVAGRTVILVDDGIATGVTARAAIKALRMGGPRQLILAVPVAPPDTAAELENEVDRIVCLETPTPFYAVGSHYGDFRQVTDAEVIELLEARAVHRAANPTEMGDQR